MNQSTLKLMEYDKIKLMLEDYAVSDLGKELISKLKPEQDIGIIKTWLEETNEARRLLDKGSSVPLSSLNGIDKVIQKLGKITAFQPDELWIIRNVLSGAEKLIRYMHDRIMIAPKVASYATSMFQLENLSREIERCILDNRVHDKASAELSRTRRHIAIIEDRIEQKLESILRSPVYKDMLQDAVVSLRGGSYVIPVKKEHKRALDGSVLDISASGSTVFIEPAAIKALKSELEIMKLEEEKEVFRILSYLTSIAVEYKKELIIDVQTMAQYDFLFAKAKLANSMNATCPSVNSENWVKIENGRHPLIGNNAIPLDFDIGNDYRSLVITGPNTGGKTVVLKTVGLFCLMTQSGLHIPADIGTEIAVFNDILADIGDGQSIEQSLSTFSSHIRNIISIIKCANNKTLVIMDELGTGTDPAEGMGLAIAIMEKLYSTGCIMICTTHYSEIKEFARMTPGFKNGSMLFDSHTLLPLFKLSIGIPGESNAFLISLRLGMDTELIERAHSITYKEYRHYERPDLFVSDQPAVELINEEIISTAEEGRTRTALRNEAKKRVNKQKVESQYKIGDCVFITSMNRTGIVCESENPRGEIGVMVMKKRLTINKKRLRPFIDGKDLYPESYDMDIVLETKDYRRNKKIMAKRHVEGLTLEH